LINWKIPAALFFIKPRLDRKIGGRERERERERDREREVSLGEKERGKEEPKNRVRKKCF
jgi:hypothetical protein